MLSNFNKRWSNFSSISSSFNSSGSYSPEQSCALEHSYASEQCASAISSVLFDRSIYLCTIWAQKSFEECAECFRDLCDAKVPNTFVEKSHSLKTQCTV